MKYIKFHYVLIAFLITPMILFSGLLNTQSNEPYAPDCKACHRSHDILSSLNTDSRTYKETYHGKAYQLGDLRDARCSDCHGSHSIFKIENPNSQLNYKNIVNTRKQCHANANPGFTGYLTHATHNDNYVLFYSLCSSYHLRIFCFPFRHIVSVKSHRGT